MDAPPDSILPADPEQDSIFVQEMVRHGDPLLACTRAGFRTECSEAMDAAATTATQIRCGVAVAGRAS
ncbi:MAG TPA: hypothetical protein VLG66_04715 [Alphaproteobacteria bacterium]|jgi:hypothetical protein|nr:hypothetical protein [Alphaproteobacteria bacterium]